MVTAYHGTSATPVAASHKNQVMGVRPAPVLHQGRANPKPWTTGRRSVELRTKPVGEARCDLRCRCAMSGQADRARRIPEAKPAPNIRAGAPLGVRRHVEGARRRVEYPCRQVELRYYPAARHSGVRHLGDGGSHIISGLARRAHTPGSYLTLTPGTRDTEY